MAPRWISASCRTAVGNDITAVVRLWIYRSGSFELILNWMEFNAINYIKGDANDTWLGTTDVDI